MDKEVYESLLTPQEAATELRVHVYTVYDLLKNGRIKGFRLNRRWRIKRTEIEAFMKSNNCPDKEGIK